MSNLSRREFLIRFATLGAAFAVGWRPSQSPSSRSSILPAAIPAHRVVQTHNDQAVYWDYATGWYGDYVRQSVVDVMTDQGVMALTNTTTLADAWSAIIPAYAAGQKVAIKINLNNAGGCGDSGQIIDALPQPVNSIIRGLKAIGVAESNICVYDVTNGWHTGQMPSRLVGKVTSLFPNVQFYSDLAGCSLSTGYSATEKVHFGVPAGKPAITDRPICNALVNATYLINLPIMKKHGMAGVTLAFKNHFGSLDHCDYVHWSVDLGDPAYGSTYSGLIDIYDNPHIKNKTVLTVGDGLYGARINNYSEVPSPWPTFGNKSPNSLFFSVDPVAIDCVMYDFLNAEGGVPAGSDNYLRLANTAGLGTFEHRDAGRQYHAIDYRRLEVSLASTPQYLPFIQRGS
jgi:hypothetical protein